MQEKLIKRIARLEKYLTHTWARFRVCLPSEKSRIKEEAHVIAKALIKAKQELEKIKKNS